MPMLQVKRSHPEPEFCKRDRIELWASLRSNEAPKQASQESFLTASGEVLPSMKRVIDGTRRCIRKGNDERVGEKQFNLLLAVESNERRLGACKYGCLSLVSSHTQVTDAAPLLQTRGSIAAPACALPPALLSPRQSIALLKVIAWKSGEARAN
jgi:hypothetical protein